MVEGSIILEDVDVKNNVGETIFISQEGNVKVKGRVVLNP